ncbi:DUF2809 domain-containing protein [Microbacterium sp. B2969]|uniref:DUF2809 domain-containing protein n=1 Tax=Microbacterium alkaliflavum TaxID=3248839 RepID=A0ABW7QGR8_9MICO
MRRHARRLWASGLLALTLGAGLVVHLLLPDSQITDIAGDALYTVAVYLAVVIVAPRLAPLVVAAIALVWCLGVELFQLTGLPGEWAAAFPPIVLVFGTVFDARDLFVYAVTVALALGIDAVVTGRSRRLAGSGTIG